MLQVAAIRASGHLTTMTAVLILGADSDIARELARQYIDHGYDLILAGRRRESLESFALDLAQYQPKRSIRCAEFDLTAYETHASFYSTLDVAPFGVVLAAGYGCASREFDNVQRLIDTNYTGAASILGIIAEDLEQRREGFIVGISSVAGERGRQSNYALGASKAALTTYLSGLRNRLHASGVHVMTVKPGFVATKMTKGMDLPGWITAQPGQVARMIFRAQQRHKSVIYVPRKWRWIMLVIRLIPEGIFKRLSL